MTPRSRVPARPCRRAPMSIKRGIARLDTRTMAVAVDLDERGKLGAERFRLRREHVGGIRAVEDDGYVRAFGPQRGDVLDFVWRDGHRIKDVGDPVREEVLRFFQRGHRDAAGLPRQCAPHDLHRLHCLHVRPQRDVKLRQVLAHAREVAIEPRAIEEQGGRFEVRKLHRWRRDVNGTRMRRL